ncbi:DNA-binding transcriptional regulator, MarR family [Lentzea xinjiangensis]|uniref:DNA-binding transcriptional regulator, MarR family n=1 Tax=Lentzea xinjiangensis TaxID=402600 RepID=A0A1H9NME1_9PSEU|nr:MarR family transcriptional regulator [Lentzea xinjiangensis]SER36809.1 DNA-binding transcriptional regulator, MarR family [Lentzea xinjiangensis]
MSQELAASLLNQTMWLAGQISGRMQEALDRLDLTGPLANVLWLLQPDADPLSLRAIAGLLHCDPSNVTLLSAKLEQRGLAERRPHPRDGRTRTLVLTEAGEEVRERLLTTVMRHSPLAGLTLEEQEQLHALLAKAIDNA